MSTADIAAMGRIAEAHEKAYGVKIGAETTYNIIQELKAARTEASASLKEEVERLTTVVAALKEEGRNFADAHARLQGHRVAAEVQLSDIREQIAYFGAVDPSDSLQADVRDTCKALIDTAQKFLAQRDGLLEAIEPFAMLADEFVGPVVEICAPHPCNPSRRIEPFYTDRFRRAKQARDACTRSEGT